MKNSELTYVDRRDSNCHKWDGLQAKYGNSELMGMWIADMDFRVPKCVQEAMRAYVDFGVCGYTLIPEGYFPSFMEWQKNEHNYEIKREWLRFVPGVVPGFNWVIRMLTEENDAVIALTPVYYPFLHGIRDNKRRLVECELVRENGYYTIDFADFEKKIVDNQVKLFMLCSPHNPVGRVWKKEELQQLLSICRKHHVYVMADEIHQDFTFGDAVQYPAGSVGDFDDMLIMLTAPSKTFNLAGFKNSFAIIPDEKLREKFDTFVNQIRMEGGNSLGYIAAEAAYRGGKPWLEEVKEVIYGNYQYLRKELLALMPELVIPPLEGTYLMWIDFAAYFDTLEKVKHFLEDQCGIATDYGAWFGAHVQSCARINLATRREDMEEVVRRVKASL